MSETQRSNPDKFSLAGLYAGFLGYPDITPAERKFLERLTAHSPYIIPGARSNRKFLGRAVRHLASQGISQFLDIGSGLPTGENVHQVAGRVRQDARVVYVDNDPKALLRSHALLVDEQETAFVQADLREPDRILNNIQVRELIDFKEPVGLLLVRSRSTLHHR
jgi:hypothetical protein